VLVSETRRVWIPDHPTLAYSPGRVSETCEDGRLLVVDDSGEQFHIPQDAAESVDPACLRGVEDLLMLGDFNEAALLHNIRVRYSEDKIYTSIGGPILISVNPYQTVPGLYSAETQMKYRKAGTPDRDRGGPPVHVYSVADAAYKAMLKDQSNQSIIISGESGAGKTEATKRVLAYLAEMQKSAFASPGGSSGQRTVEQQVLDANPVLEAFGNAKTVRNDNSSRFGKFVEVEFDPTGRLLSAQIHNYLLEKCRIVTQQPEERNYHIFYQLCAAACQGAPGVPEGLELGSALDFEYTQICDQIEGVDDVREFSDVVACMASLGFSGEERESALRIVAGVLHLGNLSFSPCSRDNQDGVAISDGQQAALICTLFGLQEEQLRGTMENHTLVDPLTKKTIHRPHDLKSASFTRHSMAKVVYARLFDWLVWRINESMSRDHGKARKDLKRIGLLDIYGFEVFDCNSFEQLCINFANEKLQCHFNKHMFTLEQELYSSEGITWSHITFQDNQPIIDTLDKKPLGLFCLVDSECMMPSATDTTLLGKVHNTFKNSRIVYKPSKFASPEFAVAHYAGEVVYNVDTFLEKNTDKLGADVVNLFKSSTVELLKTIFTNPRVAGAGSAVEPKAAAGSERSRTPTGRAGGAARRRTDPGGMDPSQQQRQRQNITVSMMFREQLDRLVEDLNRTNPRYVRCVKPNAVKRPREFDSTDVLRQLRCAGMLESIRIRRAGYAVRRPFKDFFNRFRLLAPHLAASGADPDYRSLCQRLASSVEDRLKQQGAVVEEKSWQIGQTRLFMKEDMERHYERLLVENAKSHVITLQKRVRGFLRRRRFCAVRRLALGIQCAARTNRAVAAFAEAKRRRTAALALQSAMRTSAARARFVCQRLAALTVQRCVRGWRCRRRLGKIRSKAAADKVRRLREEEERERVLQQARREAKEKDALMDSMRRDQEAAMEAIRQSQAAAAPTEELERLRRENRLLSERLHAADELNQTRAVSRGPVPAAASSEAGVDELREEVRRLRESKLSIEEDLQKASSGMQEAERRAQAAEQKLQQARSGGNMDSTQAISSLRSEILARMEDKGVPAPAPPGSGPLGSALRSQSHVSPSLASALRPISEHGTGQADLPQPLPTDGGARPSMLPGGRNTLMNQRQLFEMLKQQFNEAQEGEEMLRQPTGSEMGEAEDLGERSETQGLEEEIRRLHIENAKLRTELLSTQEETIHHASSSQELLARVSRLQAQLEDEKIGKESQVSSMRSQLEKSAATIGQQAEEISRLREEKAYGSQMQQEELERQRSVLQKSTHESHRELHKLQGDLRAKENELVNVKRVLDEVVGAHAPLDELHKWKIRAEQAEEKYHQVMRYNRNLTNEMGQITQAASDRGGDFSQLRQQVMALQQQEAKREQEARQMEHEKQELEKHLDNVQSSLNYFQSKYKSTTGDLKKAQTELVALQLVHQECERLKAQLAESMRQLSASQGSTREARTRFEVVRDSIGTLARLYQDQINLHEQNARIKDDELRRQAHERRDEAQAMLKRLRALIGEALAATEPQQARPEERGFGPSSQQVGLQAAAAARQGHDKAPRENIDGRASLLTQIGRQRQGTWHGPGASR